jgi:hypothetical protein
MRRKLRTAGAASFTALLILMSVACRQEPAATDTAASTPPPPAAQPTDDIRAIAKEAYIYGFPMVDSYRIQHAYFVDRDNPEFKAPWNTLANVPRVFTPEDKAVQTPNSDTPYSSVGMDLRAEPLVITVPPIEGERYFSIQFIDLYTFNFGYVGSRTTGNGGGSFMVAGPGWSGETPPGINQVLQSETSLVFALFRTQLFNPADLDNVKAIQAQYRVEPLSAFLGQPPAPAAPEIEFIAPLTPDEQRTSPDFFRVLNFALQFAPTHPSEEELRARFEQIGVGAGKTFDPATLTPEVRDAIAAGIADAVAEQAEFTRTQVQTGKVTSGQVFGTREFLANDYMRRMTGAVLGIYGNSQAEAMYPMYRTDALGEALDGAHRYTLRFAPGQLPPVHAFWSLTMYELPSSLLVDNPINRYLINSPMLADMVKDADGGLTLHIQNTSPGPDKEANWLPAPAGPFWIAMRLYWPKQEALEGTWTAPKLEKQAD